MAFHQRPAPYGVGLRVEGIITRVPRMQPSLKGQAWIWDEA